MALPRRGSAEEDALLKAGLCTALAMSALDALARGLEDVRDRVQPRQRERFVRVRHYSRDILSIMSIMTILPNPSMNYPDVIWVEEPITTPYERGAIKRRTQMFMITGVDGFVEFNVDLNKWSMAQDPNIDYDPNSKIIILPSPHNKTGFLLRAPKVKPVFYDDEGNPI